MAGFDPAALFTALGEARVGYILIGGFAVGAHGAVRATADVDICPDPLPANIERLAGLLANLEAESLDAAEFDASELPPLDSRALGAGGNFRLMTRLGGLDLMQWVEPFGARTWRRLDRLAVETRAFGLTVRVCGFDDLLEMKRAAGRGQDLIDIENLRAARGDAL